MRAGEKITSVLMCFAEVGGGQRDILHKAFSISVYLK